MVSLTQDSSVAQLSSRMKHGFPSGALPKVQFLEQLSPVTTSAYPTWLAFKSLPHWGWIPVGIRSVPGAS